MTFEEWWKNNAPKYPQCDYFPDDFEEIARAAWGVQQAQIDRLMLEHCPDEMTPEQIENWKKHQVPAGPDAEADLQRALGR